MLSLDRIFIEIEIKTQIFTFDQQEESYGHTAAFDKKAKRMVEIKEMRRLEKLKPNTTIEDRLGHLNYRDVWD